MEQSYKFRQIELTPYNVTYVSWESISILIFIETNRRKKILWSFIHGERMMIRIDFRLGVFYIILVNPVMTNRPINSSCWKHVWNCENRITKHHRFDEHKTCFILPANGGAYDTTKDIYIAKNNAHTRNDKPIKF